MGLRKLLGAEPETAPSGPVEGAMLDGYRDRWLPAFVRHALRRPVKLDAAYFSWKAAKVSDETDPGEIEIGRRHGWIKRAYRPGATPEDALRAAALVVLQVLHQTPQWGDVDDALRRLLAPPRL